MDVLENGLWAVLTTPFDADGGEVDLQSLRRQTTYARDAGSRGLVALGVFGEAARLSPDERDAVARTVAESAPDSRIVIGLTERETGPAIGSAHRALAATGRPAELMVQVNSPDPAVLAAHLDAIHEATGAGIVVQDYPGVSGVVITVADLLTALSGRDHVVAIKSESPPTPPAIAELTAATDRPVYGGLGGVGLLDELAAGANGAMTGFSFPHALVETIDAWNSGGYAAAREAFAPWLPLVNFEGQAAIGVSVRKHSLAEQQVIAHPAVRSPGRPMPEALLPMLRGHLAHLPR